MPTDTAAADARADDTWAWVLPGGQGTPAEALERIRLICLGGGDLFSTLLILLATHQAVPREQLAAAAQRFRPDLADLKAADVHALLTAIWNGGWQGFDAVLRSRRKAERRAGGLPFLKE